ncbi:hypothetical protein FACS189445_0500 [Spirochaetia bacterium]|nr:hypothetical protein FACS189445_0500 [Spirochaetia bacterium]
MSGTAAYSGGYGNGDILDTGVTYTDSNLPYPDYDLDTFPDPAP